MNGIHFWGTSMKLSVLATVGILLLLMGCGQRSPPAAVPLDAATLKKQQQASADDLGVSVEISNSIGMKLAIIPAGEFVMGTSREEIDRLVEVYPAAKREYFEVEYPPHRVRITKPFYLGIHEVTVGQFKRFVQAEGYRTEAERDGLGGWGWNEDKGQLGGPYPEYTWKNTGWTQTDEHPVVNVTWSDAAAFCKWLSQNEGRTYRLPTEAEWEYACRAGTTTSYHSGDDPETLARVGNVADGTAKEKKILGFQDLPYIRSRDGYVFTAPVGRFQPNQFGLFDMHGNVSEWCQDWYVWRYYESSPLNDPSALTTTSSERVHRGGSWLYGGWRCRSAYRSGIPPVFIRLNDLGFRVALVPPEN